jgi:predicted Zn-dependent protease with MMP-like domain
MYQALEYPIADIMEDSVFIVRKFAQQFQLSLRDSFNYLHKYKGLDFLKKHYGYEHTQPAYRTVEALIDVCRKHGGSL